MNQGSGWLPGSESISSRFPRGYEFSEFDERDAPWRAEAYPAGLGRRGTGAFKASAGWTTSPLAADLNLCMVDLRDWCSPVRDQGFLDSCTAFAVVALREFLMNRARQPVVELSPRYLWYLGREQAGNQHENTGLKPRDALHALLHGGCSPEEYDPYPPAAFSRRVDQKLKGDGEDTRTSLPEFVLRYQHAWAHATDQDELVEAASREPTLQAVYAAKRFTISAYHAIFLDEQAEQASRRYYDAMKDATEANVPSFISPHEQRRRASVNTSDPVQALRDVKTSLERGYGLILAGNVYADFLDPEVSASGVLPELTDHQLRYPVSSHCLFVAGYIQIGGDDRGYLICKNSLGSSWGDRGYAYMPFSYFSQRGAVLEVWTAQA